MNVPELPSLSHFSCKKETTSAQATPRRATAEIQYASVDRDYMSASSEYHSVAATVARKRSSEIGEPAMDIDKADNDEYIDRDYTEAARDVAATRVAQSTVGVFAKVTEEEYYCTDDSNDRDFRVSVEELRYLRATQSAMQFYAIEDWPYCIDDAGDRAYDTAESDIATTRVQERVSQMGDKEIVDDSNDRSYSMASTEILNFRMNNCEQHGLVLGNGRVCQLQSPVSSALSTDACNDRSYGQSYAASGMVMTLSA